MEQVVFEEYGIWITKRDHKLFLRYDSGELAVKMVEAEISEQEAQKAQRSEKDAYEIILVIQREKRERPVQTTRPI